MSKYTQEEYRKLHDLYEKQTVPFDDRVLADHIWRNSAFSGAKESPLSDYVKELKEKARLYDLAEALLYRIPLDEVPLYINHANEQIRTIAQWRLKLGK